MNTIFDANRARVDPKTDSLRLSEAQLESNRMAELDSRLSKSSHLDSLTKIERTLAAPLESVRLNGHDLSPREILSVAGGAPFVTIAESPELLRRMNRSHQAMLRDVAKGEPVYGCNTGYGAQADKHVNGGAEEQRLRDARSLSESLVFMDIGVGPVLSTEVVRSAMLIRANMLLKGVSAIRPASVQALVDALNVRLTPIVHGYGGLGASGDLAQNQRVVSFLRGLPHAKVLNETGALERGPDALRRHGLSPLRLDPKEGLALVNGDNFSTAIALDVLYRVMQLLLANIATGAWTIELLRGSNRAFHPLLSQVRPHAGQSEVSALYRQLLDGSQLAYQELAQPRQRLPGEQVQDVYSLRCLSQFEGVMMETVRRALDVITVNANSASDNPLWVPEEMATAGEEPWQWVSGGNFLAMHMAETLDSLRKIITQMIKRNDRHLARLVSAADSNGLPPNLSIAGETVSGCAFKGVQIQSGMLEVYSMVLAAPVTTLFGVCEERNQDITSHAVTFGLLALQNLELLRYSLAGNWLALAQATEFRGGAHLLSPRTQPLYRFVRSQSEQVRSERALAPDIELLAASLKDGSAMQVIREEVFHGDPADNTYAEA